LHELVLWDEHHRKQVLGCVSKFETRVSRHKTTGKVASPEDGGEFPPRKPVVDPKYPKDARACFGVGMVRNADGTYEGRRCAPYSYTGKTVLGIPKFRKAVNEQLRHVRELPHRPWDYKVKFANQPDVDGKQRWEHEVHEALRRQGTVCITEIMDHVVCESQKLYAGTAGADRFLIFHDGLSQWWEKEAQEYLHTRWSFRDRQLRCNGDTNKGTRYHNKVVGDSPELTRALDSHGFADLKRSMLFHVGLSSVYPLTIEGPDGEPVPNPRRFNMGTPAEVERTMFRCWTLEPTSDRIVEDILGLPRVLDKIIEARGTVVPDEFLRSGRRQRRADGSELKRKPIKRQRKVTNTTLPPVHADCQEALRLLKTNVWADYGNVNEVTE
jgi:hypothetical protein